MQIDQKTLMQAGIAVVVVVAAALFGQLGGGASNDAPRVSIQERAAPPVLGGKSDGIDLSGHAEGKPQAAAAPASSGDFDYYVLVLSWSPTHCSSDAGRGRDDDLQCRSGRPYGFVLHGLWPQNERGWPEYCKTSGSGRVSASNMRAALKLSPSEKLVQHEWEKHGACAGLSQDDYFAAAALAVDSVKVPPVYQALAKPLVTTPNDVRRRFLDANRSIAPDGLSATCARNELAEVWVCLDRNLSPRTCSPEVRKKHCGGREVRMLSVRGDWPG